MGFVNRFLFLFLFSISNLTWSQDNFEYSIKLKDYHSSDITSKLLTEDQNYFISADASGKVIMFDAHSFDYVKTLRKGYDVPVNSMFLARNDSVLVLSQRYLLNSPETDSLIAINLFNGKEIKKMQSFKLQDTYRKDAVVAEIYNQNGTSTAIFDRNFNYSTTLNLPWSYDKIAISDDNKLIAFSQNVSENFIKVNNISNNEELINFKFPDTYRVLHLFYDEGAFYAFLVDMDYNKLKAVKLNGNSNIEKPLFTTDYYGFYNADITHKKIEGELSIVISQHNSLSGVYPVRIVKSGDSFKAETIKVEGTSLSSSLQFQNNDKIIFFDSFNANETNVVGFKIFNTKTNSFIAEYPENKLSFYQGSFLPGNNWMVMGAEFNEKDYLLAHYENHIKYYTAGTFDNRFGALNLSGYIEVQFGLQTIPSRVFNFNKNNGVHAFYASKKDKNMNLKWGFYCYNFLTNKTETITNLKTQYLQIEDYNYTKNLLLLSNDVFFNGSITESVKFNLIKNDKELEISGDFKFGRFSNDGEYLLTITKDNLAEIRTSKDLKVFYTKQLVDGKYNIFSFDESTFVLSNSHYKIVNGSCNQESFAFEITQNQQVEEAHLDCINVLDVSYANKTIAMIVENIGVVFEDKVMKFSINEFPKNISFNDDASKFMVTLSNGRIVLYDTKSLKEIGGMVHPDKEHHVFYSHGNSFFSNMDANQFLYATKTGLPISLKQAESDCFKPEKILEMFGEPNNHYLEALNKALELRQQRNEEDNNLQNNTENSGSLGNPNLYFLSIGVSDYEDSNYDLTYADKDAMDMARFYGQLDPKTLEKYKTKFFGKKFNIYNQDKIIATMNKYYSGYTSSGNFVQLDKEALMWLEIGYKESYIWDFNTRTIKEFTLPKDYNQSISNDFIYLDPAGLGFYFHDYDHAYFYDFKLDKTERIIYPKNAQLIIDKKWIHFEENSSKGVVSVGNLGSLDADKTISFDLLNYIDGTNGKKITLDYISGTELFTVSSNGDALVYKTYDQVFYLDLTKNELIPVKINLPIEISYGNKGYLDSQKKTLSVQVKDYDSQTETLTTYSLEGKILGSSKVDFSNFLSHKGVGIYENRLVELREEEPMIEKSNYLDNDSLIENTLAFSFDKVFIKTLTDEEATKSNIEEQLKTFFSQAKANDQVMVFLAGHGVLDKKLNYYFAPHNMDFVNVSKNGIAFQELIDGLNSSVAMNKLLLMDSCHSGNTLDLIEESASTINTKKVKDGDRGSVGSSVGNKSDYKVSSIVRTLFDDFLSKSGVTVVSAASGGDLAQEGTRNQVFKGNGAFTYAYLQLLKEQLSSYTMMNEETVKKSIPLTQDYVSEVMKQVMILTNGKQVPDLREINNNVKIMIW